MSKDTTDAESNRDTTLNRRTLLRSTAFGSVVVGAVGLAGADPGEEDGNGSGRGNGNGNGRDEDEGKGFPPSGTTEYGRSVSLGNGEVRPFTTETPSGNPKYHGVEFEQAVLEGLPSAADLANADNRAETDKYRPGGQATTIHFKESLQFFVPFPDAEVTPFTFLGLNWNPGGHYGGAGAWLRPHFDVHFHMLDPATIDDIEGPKLPPYDTGNGKYTGGSPAPDPDGKVESTNFEFDQLPEGYSRAPDPVADQRYIRDMGEHTAPNDAPELPGDPDAFTNTLIQGFVSDENGSRLAFVEPMVTREFLRNFSGREEYDVPQPAAYPHDKQHPQAYSVRDVPASDTITIVLRDFEQV